MKHEKVIINGEFVPLRTCAACRKVQPKGGMSRVVKTETGVIIDAAHNKNGRGAYVCKDGKCVEKAQKIKALERSLKCAVPREVYENLQCTII